MTPVLKTKILMLETTKTRQPVSQIKIKRKRAALDKTKRAAALDKTLRVRKTMRK